MEQLSQPLPKEPMRLIIFADGSIATYVNDVLREDSEKRVVRVFEFIPTEHMYYNYSGEFNNQTINNQINKSFYRSYPDNLCFALNTKPMVTVWMVMANPKGETLGFNFFDRRVGDLTAKLEVANKEILLLRRQSAFMRAEVDRIVTGSQELRKKQFDEVKTMLDAISNPTRPMSNDQFDTGGG